MQTGNLKKVATVREMVLAGVLTLGVVYIFSQNLYPIQKTKAETLSNSIQALEKEKMELIKAKAILIRQRQINSNKIKITTAKASSTRMKILQGEKKALFDNALDFIKHVSHPEFAKGITIEQVVNKDAKDEGNYVKSTLEFRTLGGFKEQLRFIKNIEDTEALISLDNLEMIPQKDSTNMIELNIKASVYQVEGVNVIKKENL